MRLVVLSLVAGLALTGCGGGSVSPVSPSSPPTTSSSLTGTWSGSSADTTGSEAMIWTVTQNGNSMTGAVNFSDTARGMMGNGSMQGTINGSTVTFQMSVPNGGFSGMMSSCSMGMNGQATVSSDGHTMTGTYSGNMSGMMSGGMMNQSCGGATNNGHFTLTR